MKEELLIAIAKRIKEIDPAISAYAEKNMIKGTYRGKTSNKYCYNVDERCFIYNNEGADVKSAVEQAVNELNVLEFVANLAVGNEKQIENKTDVTAKMLTDYIVKLAEGRNARESQVQFVQENFEKFQFDVKQSFASKQYEIQMTREELDYNCDLLGL